MSLAAYRAAWRAKMEEINGCISSNAEQEELVDQPEVLSVGRPRGSGPLPGFDPLLFGLLPLALLLITLLAAAIPARRAFRVDPQKALRQE